MCVSNRGAGVGWTEAVDTGQWQWSQQTSGHHGLETQGTIPHIGGGEVGGGWAVEAAAHPHSTRHTHTNKAKQNQKIESEW